MIISLIYILPDGRTYLFSPLDETGIRTQMKAFKNLEKVIQEVVAKNWHDYSILSHNIEIFQKEINETA